MQEDYEKLKREVAEYELNKIRQQSANLGRNQKIAVAALAVFAVLIFGMWMTQFKKSISEPFAYKGDKNEEKQSGICQGSECQEDSEESLRNKDTDGDGLSDWDELYFYNTSPYLEDSDSDGFNDKEEIENDKDPNCPAGRDCYSAGIVEGDKGVVSDKSDSQDNNSLNSLLDQFGVSDKSGTAESAPQFDSGISASGLEALLGGQMDAASLRQLLLEYGMDKKILDKISDEDLMESFSEMMGE